MSLQAHLQGPQVQAELHLHLPQQIYTVENGHGCARVNDCVRVCVYGCLAECFAISLHIICIHTQTSSQIVCGVSLCLCVHVCMKRCVYVSVSAYVRMCVKVSVGVCVCVFVCV